MWSVAAAGCWRVEGAGQWEVAAPALLLVGREQCHGGARALEAVKNDKVQGVVEVAAPRRDNAQHAHAAQAAVARFPRRVQLAA